jgi:hypothetical protein
MIKAKENEKYLKQALKDWLTFAKSAEEFKIVRLDVELGLLGWCVPRHFKVGAKILSEKLQEFFEIFYEELRIKLVLELPKNKYISEVWHDIQNIDMKLYGYADYKAVAGEIDTYVGNVKYRFLGKKKDELEIKTSNYDVKPFAPYSDEPGPWFGGILKEEIAFVVIR